MLGTTFEAYLLVHEGGEKKISIDSVMLLDVTDYKLGVTCMFRVFARSSSPPTLTSNIKHCLSFRKKKKKNTNQVTSSEAESSEVGEKNKQGRTKWKSQSCYRADDL